MAQNPNYQDPNAGKVNGVPREPSGNAGGQYFDVSLARNRRIEAARVRKEFLNQLAEAPNTSELKIVKVRLESTAPSFLEADATGDGQNTTSGKDMVIFELTPEISESQQVIYSEIADIRQASSLLIYMGSPARRWNINAKFLARTADEAEQTYKYTQLLKSWSKPDNNYEYGDNIESPHVLRLRGYGTEWKGIPVVVTSLNFEKNSEVDYVIATGGASVPILQSVSIQLTEARTPDELDTFSLEQYKLGVLPEW